MVTSNEVDYLAGIENKEEFIKILQQMPMLIRNNGLKLTLDYLDKKMKTNKLYEEYRTILIYKMEKSSLLDMYMQKYAYNYTIKLLEVVKLLRERKGDKIKLSIVNDSECLNNNNHDNKTNANTKNYLLKLNKYTKLSYIPEKIFKYEELKVLFNKQETIISEYEKLYDFIKVIFPVETRSKLSIGFGEPSVRETSIKLDHIYGIPYIPASTIKGAFRNHVEFKCSDKSLIERWFGTEEKEGEIIFWDAYPREVEIERDVMTPHNINGKVNPIKFPVVTEGAKFHIHLSFKKENDEGKIKEYFDSFINEGSMGAKETVGYGLFKLEGEEV